MNKITKSFLMLLLLVMGAVSAQAQDAPEKDAWFTSNLFCIKDAVNGVSRSTNVTWAADPEDANNGCIQVVAPAGASAVHDCQFMIRGAEVVDATDLQQGAFAEGTGFKVTFKVKADAEYSNLQTGIFGSQKAGGTEVKEAWQYIDYPKSLDALSTTTAWQTVSFVYIADTKAATGKFTTIGFNLSDITNKTARTFYFDDVQITRLPQDEAWFNSDSFRANDEEGGDNRNEVHWVLDPANPENSCFSVTSMANAANAHDTQLWIRATAPSVQMAEGQVAKLVMRVKADRAQSGIATQYHQDFKYFNCYRGFGNLDVTTDWKTVVLTGAATSSPNPSSVGFTDFCFNLCDLTTKEANTFYFDDVQIVIGEPGQAEWYVKAEPWAADYEGFTEKYTTDPPTQVTTQDWSGGWPPKDVPAYYDEEKTDPKYLKTTPEKAPARWVAADDGGYVEVKSNAKPINNYDSQLFIQVSPVALKAQQRVTVSMKVQADAESKQVETQVHKGVGDWTNQAAGDKIDFTVGEWTDITREFSIENADLQKEGSSVWYVLNLSNGMEANTYRFKDIKVEIKDGEDVWYQNNEITYVDNTGKESEPTKVFGDDFCIKVASAAEASSKIQFTIPSTLVGKQVQVDMKVKASVAGAAAGALIDGETSTEADGIEFTAEWADAQVILDTEKGSVYELTLAGGEAGVDYFFDNLAFKEYIPEVNYEEPELSTTEQWYQDLAAQGTKLISRNEPGYNLDNDKGDLPVRYIRGEGEEGDYLEYVGRANVTETWMGQVFINMTESADVTLPAGTVITVTMKIKASESASIGSQAQGGPGGYLGGGIATLNFTTDWTDYKATFTIPEEGNTAKTTCFSLDFASKGDHVRTFWMDDVVVAIEPPINPDDYEWTDILNGEGNFENAKSDYFIGKIMKGHENKETITNEDGEEEVVKTYVFDDDDPEFIRLESSVAETLLAWKPAEGFEFGTNVLDIQPARQKTNDAGEYAGNAWDSQFFIRLPYVLPVGAKIGVELDVWCSQTATIPVQEHMEADGNGYLGDFNVLKSIAVEAKQAWQHVAKYGKVDKDMRSIVFNLANVPSGAVYRFDNVKVFVENDDLTTVKAYQESVEAPATAWDNFLALNEKISEAKAIETEGYTEESVQALDDAIADGKALLKVEQGEEPYTDDQLVAAKTAVEDAIAGLVAVKPEMENYTDLTKEMFFHWDAADAAAKAVEASNCDYNVGTATAQPYGLSTVDHDRFADLSGYKTIEVTVTDGTEPRLLFNRTENQGTVYAEVPRDAAKYEKVYDNADGSKTYVIDIAAIVAEYGFAHLHAVKANGFGGVTTTVTAMKLGYEGEQPALPSIVDAIDGIAAGAAVKDGKYFINGQIVIVKGGKQYNAAGVEIK